MRYRFAFILAIVINFSFPSLSLSCPDGLVAYDNGYTVYPLNSDKIRLLSVKVTALLDGPHDSRAVKVTGLFVFENLTDNTVKASVGFPTHDSESQYAYKGPARFLFDSYLDGKPVDYNIKKEVVRNWEYGGNPEYGIPPREGEVYRYWHTWDVVIPPNGKVQLLNKYSANLSHGINHETWFNYDMILDTDMNIPIGEFVLELVYKSEDDLLSSVKTAEPEGYTIIGNKLVWDFNDFIPSKNIRVSELQGGANSKNIEAKNLNIAIAKYMEKKKYAGSDFAYKREDISRLAQPLVSFYKKNREHVPQSEYVEMAYFNWIKKSYLSALRNEIFARHGREFQSPELIIIFKNTSWYKPDPEFTDEMLNDIEKKNVQFILDYEKELGYR